MTENQEICRHEVGSGVTLDEILEGIRIGDTDMIERFLAAIDKHFSSQSL